MIFSMFIQMFFFKFHDFSMHEIFLGGFSRLSMISRACGNPDTYMPTVAQLGIFFSSDYLRVNSLPLSSALSSEQGSRALFFVSSQYVINLI